MTHTQVFPQLNCVTSFFFFLLHHCPALTNHLPSAFKRTCILSHPVSSTYMYIYQTYFQFTCAFMNAVFLLSVLLFLVCKFISSLHLSLTCSNEGVASCSGDAALVLFVPRHQDEALKSPVLSPAAKRQACSIQWWVYMMKGTKWQIQWMECYWCIVYMEFNEF